LPGRSRMKARRSALEGRVVGFLAGLFKISVLRRSGAVANKM
jgi:hypothetical protein